jgi:hypothetical protein
MVRAIDFSLILLSLAGCSSRLSSEHADKLAADDVNSLLGYG